MSGKLQVTETAARAIVEAGTRPRQTAVQTIRRLPYIDESLPEYEDPCEFNFIERQSSGSRGVDSDNGYYIGEHCGLMYRSNFYDQDFSSVEVALKFKPTWEVAFDYTGRNEYGTPRHIIDYGYEQQKYLTPCLLGGGLQGRIISASTYVPTSEDDPITAPYRDGLINVAPVAGVARFPYPIRIGWVSWWGGRIDLSFDDWEKSTDFGTFYETNFNQGANLDYQDNGIKGISYRRILLDTPRLHFDSISDVPSVFFRANGLVSTLGGGVFLAPYVDVPLSDYYKGKGISYDENEDYIGLYEVVRGWRYEYGKRISPKKRRTIKKSLASGSGIGNIYFYNSFDAITSYAYGLSEPDAPIAPTNVTATKSGNYVTVTWSATDHFAFIASAWQGEGFTECVSSARVTDGSTRTTLLNMREATSDSVKIIVESQNSAYERAASEVTVLSLN